MDPSPTSPASDETPLNRPLPKHVQFRRASRDSSTRRLSDAKRVRSSMDTVKAEDQVNGSSPLLAASEGTLDPVGLQPLNAVTTPSSSESVWLDQEDGQATIQESKSSWYLFLLTLSIGGLQIGWAVELSNGSPYLLGLGISKSLLALVWIAGPLSGTLVQPYVGIKSDRCRSRFGKRRPFMVGGAAATIVSLMALAWARELVGGFLSIFGAPKESNGVRITTIVFAVIMIYVLDFSINVIQAGIRAFIVDNAPTHQQDSANAWASRLTGIGSIIGYTFGYIDLPRYLWFFGDTQFKVLCVIASVTMAATLAVSCLAIRERDPRLEGDPSKQDGGVFSFFITLYHSIRKLPPQISKVCQTQFFAWIGWFPFLFYTTTYIAEIYVEPIYAANPDMTPEEIDATWERGTRVGTFALLIFAITTFASSVLLPFIVASTYKAPAPPLRTPMTPGATTPHTPTATNSSSYFSYQPVDAEAHSLKSTDPSRSSVPRRFFLPHHISLEIPWLTLRRAWMLSHVFFALLTWLTFLAKTATSATVLIGFIGIPWAMTNWAPFALIAAEISKRDSIRRGLTRPPPTRDGELLAHGEDPSDGADQAGVVLGIHNVAIAAPQVIATLVSSAIFKALQKPKGSVGDDSVAWVLRFGGVAALIAAWMTRRVGEEGRT